MGKLPYPFPLETSKDNRRLGSAGQRVDSVKVIIVLACIRWPSDWVAETYFVVVAKGKKTFNLQTFCNYKYLFLAKMSSLIFFFCVGITYLLPEVVIPQCILG